MSHPLHFHVNGSPINRYLRLLGFSLCISSVEGVVSGDTHYLILCLVGKNRIDSILIGSTEMDVGGVFDHVTKLQNVYLAASYHPITNNSHHFAECLYRNLTGIPIPRWLNRIAAIGLCCRCLFNKERKAEMPLARPNGDGDGDGSHRGNNSNKFSRWLSGKW